MNLEVQENTKMACSLAQFWSYSLEKPKPREPMKQQFSTNFLVHFFGSCPSLTRSSIPHCASSENIQSVQLKLP